MSTSTRDPASTLEIVSRLRKLQNTMGDIVDCHVQRQLVLDWRARLDRRTQGQRHRAANGILEFRFINRIIAAPRRRDGEVSALPASILMIGFRQIMQS